MALDHHQLYISTRFPTPSTVPKTLDFLDILYNVVSQICLKSEMQAMETTLTKIRLNCLTSSQPGAHPRLPPYQRVRIAPPVDHLPLRHQGRHGPLMPDHPPLQLPGGHGPPIPSRPRPHHLGPQGPPIPSCPPPHHQGPQGRPIPDHPLPHLVGQRLPQIPPTIRGLMVPQSPRPSQSENPSPK